MLFIKIIGLALLFICFSLGGYFAAGRLCARAKTLDKVCNGIKRYQSLMNLSGREVPCILPESFNDTGIIFSDNKATLPRDIVLDREEKAMLESFFEGIGNQDKDGENRRCEIFLNAFEQQRKAARQSVREKRKIYLVSGVCSAVAAVVLFI